jgi:Mrp family chromosome partitioning ATPase
MERAREEFTYIVLDTPPVGVVSDALVTGIFTDVNIFVIRQRYSYKSTLEMIQLSMKRRS